MVPDVLRDHKYGFIMKEKEIEKDRSINSGLQSTARSFFRVWYEPIWLLAVHDLLQ